MFPNQHMCFLINIAVYEILAHNGSSRRNSCSGVRFVASSGIQVQGMRFTVFDERDQVHPVETSAKKGTRRGSRSVHVAFGPA